MLASIAAATLLTIAGLAPAAADATASREGQGMTMLLPCRVGMSTDPDACIRHWKRTEGHTGAMILATGLTYDEAQARETAEAHTHGCWHSPGGRRVSGQVWSVYLVCGRW